MTKTLILIAVMLTQPIGFAQHANTYVAHYSYPSSGPQVYRESKSGILIYVESDGRHMAGISPDGKLLWNRNPFANAGLPFYRVKDPQVASIEAASREDVPKGQRANAFVAIRLTNSQFGLLRVSDGDFLLLGQD